MFPSFYLAFHDPIHLLQPPNGIPHVSFKSLSIVRFIAFFDRNFYRTPFPCGTILIQKWKETNFEQLMFQ